MHDPALGRLVGLNRASAVLGVLAGLGLSAPADAGGPRIKTGADLLAVCEVAARYDYSRPSREDRIPTLLCHRYIEGYVRSLTVLSEDETTRKVEMDGDRVRFQCADVPRVVSLPQLANRVVLVGRARPALMSAPAAELIEQVFDVESPC